MKRTVLCSAIIVFTLFASSSFVKKSSTGITGQTGSPGEQTCAGGGCHGGGSSATKGVTISAIPSFTNNKYKADSTYLIQVQVGAVGFSRFGFGCEILDSTNANAGNMQNPGVGVQIANHFNGRTNAIHTAKKVGSNGVTFTFEWVAPSDGKVTFYVCGNAVNNNATTSGDLPIPASKSMYPAPLVVDSALITGISNSSAKDLSSVSVYPNPSADLTTVSYSLKQTEIVTMDLIGIDGAVVKKLFSGKETAGAHSRIVSVDGIKSGVYFLKISTEGTSSQKLLTIQ